MLQWMLFTAVHNFMEIVKEIGDSNVAKVYVSKIGDHLIEFGNIERMDEKFRNLRALYKTGWESREWNLYKRVNLKYKGQVVCTKA